MTTPANTTRTGDGKSIPSFPENQYAVTCSDTVDLPRPMTVFVTTAGAYKVNDAHGVSGTWTLAAGACFPFLVSRVWVTGSVATTGVNGVY